MCDAECFTGAVYVDVQVRGMKQYGGSMSWPFWMPQLERKPQSLRHGTKSAG